MTEPALAPRPDDAVSSQPNPFSSLSSSSDLNYTPAGPMFGSSPAASSPTSPAPLSSSPSASSPSLLYSATPPSFSGTTPAFLDYSPAYGDDPIAGVCRTPPPPASAGASTGGATPRPQRPSRTTATGQAASSSGTTGAPRTTSASSGAGGPRSQSADAAPAAGQGAAARRRAAGGSATGGRRRESESDGNDRRAADQTRMRLALPPSQAARGAARIGRQPLFLGIRARTFDAPRALDVALPDPQKREREQAGSEATQTDPAAARDAYARAARESEALFDRILAGAAQLARDADASLRSLTDRHESQLGRALARLEDDFAQRRLDAANRRDFVLNHIASRTDLLRFYVAEQANGALARMAALRKQLESEIGRIRTPTVQPLAALRQARDDAYQAANDAHFAIQGMQRDPPGTFAGASEFQVVEGRVGPELVAAMLEAAIYYGPTRFDADDQALADRLDIVGKFVDPLIACSECEIDGKVYAAESAADNLGAAGPAAIRSARDSTLHGIDQAEQKLTLNVLAAFHTTEGSLAERHNQTRAMLTAQSTDETLELRRDIESSGQKQVDALTGVAATQPAALKMVHDEVEKAAAANPTRAAAQGKVGAERLLRNVRNVAERHPASVLATAQDKQGSRLDRASAAGREQASLAQGFDGQQKQFVGDSFDQMALSVEESLVGMAGMPGQVGQTCDEMLRGARQTLTRMSETTQEEIDAIVAKLNGGLDGLIPPPPGHQSMVADPQFLAPPSLLYTPAEQPNMLMTSPAPVSSVAPSGPMSSMMSPGPLAYSSMLELTPAPTSSVMATPTTGTTTGEGQGAGGGGGPASCGTCETVRGAAQGPTGPQGGAAATATGTADGGTTTGTTSPAGSTSPSGGDVGVCSDRTEMRSPRAFKAHCEPIARNPLFAPRTAEFVTLVHDNLNGMIGQRVEWAHEAIETTGETDYTKLFKQCLRGLTRQQGRAFSEMYQQEYNRDLASEIRDHAGDSWFTTAETDNYNSDAAIAALEGRAADGALNELRAAFNYSNETTRIFEVMQSLTHDQMEDLVSHHRAELQGLMDQLSTEDQARFRLLMDNNTVRARSTELKGSIDQVNNSLRYGGRSDQRGFALGDALDQAEHADRWGLEGDANRVDVFRLEDSSVREAREHQHWQDIQQDFGYLDGVAEAVAQASPQAAVSRPDDPPGAVLLAYASRPLTYQTYATYQREGETREQALERQRSEAAADGVTLGEEQVDDYGNRTLTATTSLSEYQQLYLRMAVVNGSQSREARAARALAQLRRRDGQPPDYRDMELSLHSGLGDARAMGHFEHGSPEEAEQDRLQTFIQMEQFRRQIEGGASGPIDGRQAQAQFRRDMEAAYRDRPQDLDVAIGVIDSDQGNMQAVIDQAIAREDPALLNRYLGRMDSQQIEAVVTRWNERHPGGPGLRETLGVGKDNHWNWHNWNGAVFTGDEANALEIAMMGVPQTSQQDWEVKYRMINQQIEQSGWLGRLMAHDEYQHMLDQAQRLREVAGVNEGQVDDQGRIQVIDPQTHDRIAFNFDEHGNLVPAHAGDAAVFQRLLATSRLVADNYANAVDRMASYITTGIALIAAVVLSVVTMGAGTAVAIALLAGAMTIAVNASMRGGRYSRDDLTRDVVATAVQMVTAGIGAGMGNVARGAQEAAAAAKVVGGVAAAERATVAFAESLGTTERVLLAASRHPILTQAALGAFSSGVSTALDPATRRRDDYGDQVMHSIFRGGFGGAATAGIAHVITSGATGALQRLAARRAMAEALERGASSEAALRFAARAYNAAARSHVVEIGVRTLAGGVSGMAGRGLEMGYDNEFNGGHHSGEDFYREMRNAFIHSAAQSFFEGVGTRGKRLYTAGGAEEDRDAMILGREDAERAAGRAFDREMARSARAAGNAPPPAAAAGGGEHEAPPAPPPAPANDNEAAEVQPARRAVGEREEGAPGRPRQEDEDLRLRSPDGEELPASERPTREIPVYKPNTFAEHLASTEVHPPRVRDTVDLSPSMLKGAPSVPEGSEFRATDAHNPEAALANYHALREADPHREVLLARCIDPSDERYGQFLVFQGGESSVSKPPRGWIAERHSHPRLVSGELAERLTRSLPSGSGGDFAVLRSEVDMQAGLVQSTQGIRRESVIDIRLGELSLETHFSVTRNGDQYEYRVSFRPPHDGVEHMGPFFSLADYEASAGTLTGQRFGKGAGETYSTAEGVVSRAPPRPVHGDPITTSMRGDIEFVRQRMALAGEFEGQLSGGGARGDIDPSLGRAATLSDAHQRVARMGLVGEPDSMIRLHNILNDDSIPVAVRAMISDVTLAATRDHLLRTGELQPGEPLILLFHGATPERTQSLVKNGIDMARGPGGPHDDFGEGLYFTRSLETALQYSNRRSSHVQGDPPGGVIPYMLRGSEMGASVDVSSRGNLRAQWEAFASANAATLLEGGNMMFNETVGRILTGQPVGFSDFDAQFHQNRGKLFNDFLGSIDAHPSVIFGDLGGPLTHGIQLREVTDQVVVRSQEVADILNRQHVRAGTTDAETITAGGGPGEDDLRMRTASLIAPRPVDRDEAAARLRTGPHVDEINAAQAALATPHDENPRALIARIRAGGADAADAQGKLNALYNTPRDAEVINISDAEIRSHGTSLSPGDERYVTIQGMEFRLYRPESSQGQKVPPIQYDASVPPGRRGERPRVYQFGDGDLRVWRTRPTVDEPAGRIVQSSLIGDGVERQGFEDALFSHGESYDRTADTPIGPQAGGYHGPALERGHLHGAGLGVESRFGIGMVPREVNQALQNRGIEGWMRRVRDALPPGAELVYSTDVSWHRTSARQSRIGYRLDIILQGKRVPFAEFAVNIEADPPWTPAAQRRGTRAVTVEPLEWRSDPQHERVNNYLRALHELVDIPEVLHSGLARRPPSREEVGQALHDAEPATVVRAARQSPAWALASHNPQPAGTFKVSAWQRGLDRILNRQVRPRYIVVDLRGLGLRPSQKEEIGRALARLPERDRARILLLDDKTATYSSRIPRAFHLLLLAPASDDDDS